MKLNNPKEQIRQIKFIHFFLTYKCNYNCEYCCQDEVTNKSHADDAVIEAFTDLIKDMGNKCIVHITGGEALTHPRFFDVVESIISSGHKLSLVTNFSFPLENYKKLVDICGENLINLFASLHLSQVKSTEEFINKAKFFNKYKNDKTIFRTLSVLNEYNFNLLKSLKQELAENNIKLSLQRLRINGQKIKYNEEIENYLEENPNNSAVLNQELENYNLYGTICEAGCNSFFINSNGDVRRCYTPGQKGLTWLGNIKNKTFTPFKNPMPCLSRNCNCSKLITDLELIDFNSKNYPQAIFLSMFSSFAPNNLRYQIEKKLKDFKKY